MHLCWLHVLCVDQLDDGAKLFKLWGFLGEALILLYKVGISLQGVDDRGASSSSQDRPCSKCSSGNQDVTVSLTDVTLCVTVSTKLGNICILNYPTCFQAQGYRRPCTCARGCSLGGTCKKRSVTVSCFLFDQPVTVESLWPWQVEVLKNLKASSFYSLAQRSARTCGECCQK